MNVRTSVLWCKYVTRCEMDVNWMILSKRQCMNENLLSSWDGRLNFHIYWLIWKCPLWIFSLGIFSKIILWSVVFFFMKVNEYLNYKLHNNKNVILMIFSLSQFIYIIYINLFLSKEKVCKKSEMKLMLTIINHPIFLVALHLFCLLR